MRLKMVTHSLESYEEVLWFHDIPDHEDCTCVTNPSEDTGEEASETWIEVDRNQLYPPHQKYQIS